ncbi:MAG: sensor hybrid histidine kinase [Myxococcales bacterium]|nr:sensor hybrid histidine kinase [Myxococcales bacterium]
MDDDVDVADTLGELATLLGHSVTIANSEREGRTVLRVQSPEMVICDLNLGDGTGEEILRLAAVFHPDACRVLMTAASGSISSRLLSSGIAQRLLRKPFGLDELRSLLGGFSRERLCA